MNDLNELNLYAQLVATDERDVAEIVKRALARRQEGDQSSASDLIQQVAAGFTLQPGDLLAERLLASQLDAVLPIIFLGLPHSRRVAFMRAFSPDRPDPSERSVFVILVKRALEEHFHAKVSVQVTETDVHHAIERYVEVHVAPPSRDLVRLASSMESSSADGSSTIGSSVARKLPLSARIAAGLVVILLAAAIGTWISAPDSPSQSSAVRVDLFAHLAERDSASEPAFRGQEESQVERYIEDRLDRRLQVPLLDNAGIQGVTIESLGNGIEIPLLHYTLASNDIQVGVYVLDYRILNEIEGAFFADRAVLQQISEPNGVDIRDGDSYRVTFRNRDDIYVAVTSEALLDLASQFRFQ